jgi:hypothetical protein
VTPRARADVEHSAADELERGPLRLDPPSVLGEEPLGAHSRPDVAVVALELRLLPGSSFEVVEERKPEGVLIASEDPGYAASDVRKPSSAAIGRIAAITFRM